MFKHCDPDPGRASLVDFVRNKLSELERCEPEVLRLARFDFSTRVHLTIPRDLDCEIAATLLYEQSHYPFHVLYQLLEEQKKSWAHILVEEAAAIRGKHEELSRAFRAAAGLVFDIYMDIGGMRDMHRHRSCTRIFQKYDAQEWAAPELANLPVEFKYAMNRAQLNFEFMRRFSKSTSGWRRSSARRAGDWCR